nr:methylmalonyl-CoA mutase [Desulfobacterales bacterium]
MTGEDTQGPVRVLVAVPGIDCHERAVLVISDALRRAGMEVIYLGCYNTPEKIVTSAIQEDVDVIALSYALDHLYIEYFPKVVKLLDEEGANNIRVVGGGHIAEEHKPFLEEKGISGLFGPGTSMDVIINHIKEVAKRGNRG